MSLFTALLLFLFPISCMAACNQTLVDDVKQKLNASLNGTNVEHMATTNSPNCFFLLPDAQLSKLQYKQVCTAIGARLAWIDSRELLQDAIQTPGYLAYHTGLAYRQNEVAQNTTTLIWYWDSLTENKTLTEDMLLALNLSDIEPPTFEQIPILDVDHKGVLFENDTVPAGAICELVQGPPDVLVTAFPTNSSQHTNYTGNTTMSTETEASNVTSASIPNLSIVQTNKSSSSAPLSSLVASSSGSGKTSSGIPDVTSTTTEDLTMTTKTKIKWAIIGPTFGGLLLLIIIVFIIILYCVREKDNEAKNRAVAAVALAAAQPPKPQPPAPAPAQPPVAQQSYVQYQPTYAPYVQSPGGGSYSATYPTSQTFPANQWYPQYQQYPYPYTYPYQQQPGLQQSFYGQYPAGQGAVDPGALQPASSAVQRLRPEVDEESDRGGQKSSRDKSSQRSTSETRGSTASSADSQGASSSGASSSGASSSGTSDSTVPVGVVPSLPSVTADSTHAPGYTFPPGSNSNIYQ